MTEYQPAQRAFGSAGPFPPAGPAPPLPPEATARRAAAAVAARVARAADGGDEPIYPLDPRQGAHPLPGKPAPEYPTPFFLKMFSQRMLNRIIDLPSAVRSRSRITAYRALGAQIGTGCRMSRVMIPYNPWDVQLGDRVSLDNHIVLLCVGPRTGKRKIVIGDMVYCNRFTMFDASELVEIGSDVMIGPHCYITDHDHGIEPGQSVHTQPLRSAPTRIGTGCWIGAQVTILKGVTVGEGAIVAAGSVVTKDIPAGSVAAGVPARVMRDR